MISSFLTIHLGESVAFFKINKKLITLFLQEDGTGRNDLLFLGYVVK